MNNSDEAIIRNLKSLGVVFDTFGPVLIPTILTKISEAIRLKVAKVTNDEDWDFEKVWKYIKSELKARGQICVR